jgi:hypothetical protein
MEVVEESNTAQQLTGERLDVMAGKWGKVVLLQKIVHTHPQQLRDYTDVVAMVEPLQ